MYRLFYQGRNEHLAFNKKVQLISPDPADIPEEEILKLTDGIRASNDSKNNWFDFRGKDLDAVIDLGKVKKVQHIECAFYQLAAWLSLVPKRVSFLFPRMEKPLIRSERLKIPCRSISTIHSCGTLLLIFLRLMHVMCSVVAHTIGNTPESHPGAGQPAWMHIDEIVVE